MKAQPSLVQISGGVTLSDIKALKKERASLFGTMICTYGAYPSDSQIARAVKLALLPGRVISLKTVHFPDFYVA